MSLPTDIMAGAGIRGRPVYRNAKIDKMHVNGPIVCEDLNKVATAVTKIIDYLKNDYGPISLIAYRFVMLHTSGFMNGHVENIVRKEDLPDIKDSNMENNVEILVGALKNSWLSKLKHYLEFMLVKKYNDVRLFNPLMTYYVLTKLRECFNLPMSFLANLIESLGV